MNKTKIQWAEMTWNPVTGCTAISPGCQNCYAKEILRRFPNGRTKAAPFRVICHEEGVV